MVQDFQKTDKMELFHNTMIQHGPLSNRIYLMKLNDADPDLLIRAMDDLAQDNGYTKIFAKVPACQAEIFLDNGYRKEASVNGFFHGQEAAFFLARYLDSERAKDKALLDLDNIVDLALKKDKRPESDMMPDGVQIRICSEDDAKRMSEIYQQVFPSYPFPIDDPSYIVKTMKDHVVYFGIELDGTLVALSSAEMDRVSKNVEMTDFATLPEYRGNNYSGLLLREMEYQMRSRGILTAYTIARAMSPGMNITFARVGYAYGGRLINNTNISGRIESMNVWHKSL